MKRLLTILFLFMQTTMVSSQESKIREVIISNRQVDEGLESLRVNEGDRVELRWRSEEAVALHLHGYEITVEVPAGGSAVMAFEAVATGRFPISHHGFGAVKGKDHGHRPILYLEVYPR